MKSSGSCGFTAFTPPEPSPDARDGRPDGGHRCADAVVPPAGSGQLAAGRVGGARGAPRATPGDAPRLILAHAALVADRTSWSPPLYAECHSPTSIYRGLVGPTAQPGLFSRFSFRIQNMLATTSFAMGFAPQLAIQHAATRAAAPSMQVRGARRISRFRRTRLSMATAARQQLAEGRAIRSSTMHRSLLSAPDVCSSLALIVAGEVRVPPLPQEAAEARRCARMANAWGLAATPEWQHSCAWTG